MLISIEITLNYKPSGQTNQQWLSAEHVTTPYLKIKWSSLLTHICTRPQWVKWLKCMSSWCENVLLMLARCRVPVIEVFDGLVVLEVSLSSSMINNRGEDNICISRIRKLSAIFSLVNLFCSDDTVWRHLTCDVNIVLCISLLPDDIGSLLKPVSTFP